MTEASSMLPQMPSKNSLSETKSHRVDEVVTFVKRHPVISARKAATIYNVNPSSIDKRLLGQTRSKEVYAQVQQSLTPVKEDVLAKWALQYWAWGLPL
jgi:hypothetical protein